MHSSKLYVCRMHLDRMHLQHFQILPSIPEFSSYLFIFNNSSGPISAAHMCMGKGPSAVPWASYRGPYPQRKVGLPSSASMNTLKNFCKKRNLFFSHGVAFIYFRIQPMQRPCHSLTRLEVLGCLQSYWHKEEVGTQFP